jgi:hypothetical protein
MVGLYVALIVTGDGNTFLDVLPWALLMLIAALLAVAGVQLADRRLARNLLVGAAVLYGLLGVISLLTIGLLFVLVAFSAVIAAARLSSENTS